MSVIDKLTEETLANAVRECDRMQTLVGEVYYLLRLPPKQGWESEQDRARVLCVQLHHSLEQLEEALDGKVVVTDEQA